MTPRRIAGLLALLVAAGLVGCSSGAGATSATPSPTTTTATSATVSADLASTVCQRFATAATTLRGVLDTARQGPVLGPALYLLLLNPRNVASTPSITEPVLAKAMQDLVAALDELADQAQRRLPPGADPAKTPVQLDTARTSAELTGAEAACKAHR